LSGLETTSTSSANRMYPINMLIVPEIILFLFIVQFVILVFRVKTNIQRVFALIDIDVDKVSKILIHVAITWINRLHLLSINSKTLQPHYNKNIQPHICVKLDV